MPISRITKTLIMMLCLSLLVGCGGGISVKSQSQLPGLDLSTHCADSTLEFSIDPSTNTPITYTVYYNDRIYKTYQKSESHWTILFDYSFQETTEVKVQGVLPSGEIIKTTALVVIDPADYDFSKNTLPIYVAGSQPLDLASLQIYGDRLVSLDVKGEAIRGDLSDLSHLNGLTMLRLTNCTKVTGSVDVLEKLKGLQQIEIQQ